jgi:molybdopterin synthase sulfur carrier subunit
VRVVPTLTFARAFRRHVDCPDASVAGATVGELLDDYFTTYPHVRTYVLDDTGAVRRHITLFVGDQQLDHVHGLQTPVQTGDTVSVFQALSGG